MTAELMTLQVRSRRQWRAWLAKHHTSSPGVWLVFHKAHTGVESIPYEDTVREALCFGWIDSLIKRLDDDRYALKVTPRQRTSKWSDLRRGQVVELILDEETPSPERCSVVWIGKAGSEQEGEVGLESC